MVLVAINVTLIPTTNYFLRGKLLPLQVNALFERNLADANRMIVERYAFELNLSKALALSEPGKYSIYLADGDRPFVGAFAGQAFAASWYDSDFQAAAATADLDLTGAQWQRLFARTGIKYVLAKNETSEPSALGNALHTGTTKIMTAQGHTLYCFCDADPARQAMPLYKARDLSTWLRFNRSRS